MNLKILKKAIAILTILVVLLIAWIKVNNNRESKIAYIENIEKQKMENTVDYSQLKIGDYVAYDPKNVTDQTLLNYTIDDETYTVQDGTQWRVLNIDNTTGKIELISTTPVIEYSMEGGTEAYLYVARDLNRLCSIYGYGYGSDRAEGTIYTIGGPWEKEINIKILGTAGRALNVEDVNKLHGIGKEKNGTTVNKEFIELNPRYGIEKHYELKNVDLDTFEVDLDGIWATPSINGNSGGHMIDVVNTYYSYDIASELINSEVLASNAISTTPIGMFADSYQDYDLYIGYCVRVINNGKVDAEPTGVCVDGGDIIDFQIPYTRTQAIVRLKSNLNFYSNSNLETAGTADNPWQIK